MRTIKEADMELCSTEKIEYTKECGLMTKDIKKDMNVIVMVIHMREILKKERLMVKVFITGQTERYMTESGAEELRMDMECGKEYLEIATWDNG